MHPASGAEFDPIDSAAEGASLEFLPVPHGFVFIGPLHLS